MNIHNFAQRTNWTAGSDRFPLIPFYLTTVNIPGMSFSLPETGSRYGAKLNLSSDTVSYNSLNFNFLIDEDFEIYKKFNEYLTECVDVEGLKFNNIPFMFWVELNDNKSHKILKFEFYNCRIENIGDIELDTTNPETEITMDLSLKFDYFKIV